MDDLTAARDARQAVSYPQRRAGGRVFKVAQRTLCATTRSDSQDTGLGEIMPAWTNFDDLALPARVAIVKVNAE